MRYYFTKIKVRTYEKIYRIMKSINKSRLPREYSYWGCEGREAESGIAIDKANLDCILFRRAGISKVDDTTRNTLMRNKFFSLPEIFFRRVVYFKLADRK